MPLSYILIPFLTAFTGWVAVWALYKFSFYPTTPKKIMGFTVKGIIWTKLPAIQNALSNYAANEIINMNEMEQKITDPKNMDKIMPMAEEQVEYFLRNKLKDVFPMIGMFIGDKTINQLKEVFMAELKALFPAAIKMYAAGLKENLDVEKMINQKISAALVNTMIPSLEKNAWSQLKNIALAAAGFGFFIGVTEVILLNFF